MERILAQSEPVAIAALAGKCFSFFAQLLCLQSQVLCDQTLIDKCVEDLTKFALLHTILDRLDLYFLHLVQGQGLHSAAKEGTTMEEASLAPLLSHLFQTSEGSLQQNGFVVG